MQHNAQDSSNVPTGRSFTVGAKIMANVGFCLVLLIVVAGLSIWQMTKIGAEIEGIAERDVPLTRALTAVTIHQLEQAINFERAVRAGRDMQSHSHAGAEYSASTAKFEDLGVKIDDEIVEAAELAMQAMDKALSGDERAEFEMVLQKLSDIKTEHADYDHRVKEVFKLIASEQYEHALTLLPKIEEEEEDLDKTLEDLLMEVGSFTEHAAKVAEEHEKSAILMLGIAASFAFVFGLATAYLIVRKSINRPLAEVVKGLEALIAGDLAVEVRIYANDEIGAVARSFSTFKQNIARTRELEAEQTIREQRTRQERIEAMNTLASGFDHTVGGMVETVTMAVTDLKSTAQTMASIAEETSSQAVVVSAASEEASTNVQTVASSAEEMSASIEEITIRVVEASRASKQAVDEVGRTAAQMSVLVENANKVGDVVSMISDIAEQTNLLALNATIESARAGDAGKGFAVVAGEVKALAGQTGKATEEITRRIQEIQQTTSDTLASITNVTKIIEVMDTASSTIAAALEEQGAVTQEIARSVHEAASGTEQVADNITGVSQASQEAGSAASKVMSKAAELFEQATALKFEANKFVAEVRAG